MFCTKCGKELRGELKFCPNCGSSNLPQSTNSPVPTSQTRPIIKKKSKFYKYFGMSGITLFAILSLAFNSSIQSTKKLNIENGQYYTIQEDGSQLKFPVKPSRSEQQITADDGSVNKVVSYIAQNMGNVYFFIIGEHGNQDINKDNPNFSVDDFLEQNFQNTISSDPSNKIIFKEKVIFNGKSAVRFAISNENGDYQGITFLNGKLGYTMMLGTSSGASDSTTKEMADIFFNSLKLK